MYITLYDCGLFVLMMIILIVSAYLIAVLRQTFFLFRHIRGIFITHDNEIRETLSLLPVTLANINLLSVGLAATANQTSRIFQSLQTDVTDTVDDLHSGLKTIMIYAKMISEIFKLIFTKAE